MRQSRTSPDPADTASHPDAADPAAGPATDQAPAVPRSRGPSPAKTAQTRALILGAALAEFLEHGFSASTMTRIAERAGLAKGTAYRYFATKEALFVDLMRELVTNPLRAAHETPAHGEETTRAYCQRTLVPLMAVIEDSGRADIARLALTESRAFPEFTAAYRQDVYLPFLGHLAGLARRAADRGEIAPAAVAHAAHLLAAPLWIGLLQNGILDPQRPLRIDVLFESQLDLVFGRLEGAGGQ